MLYYGIGKGSGWLKTSYGEGGWLKTSEYRLMGRGSKIAQKTVV